MNLTDALAQAAAHGWSDDSRYTPSTVEAQVSTKRDGLLASVTVLVSGKIKWNVCSLTDAVRSQRGEAESIEAAFAACDDTVAAVRGTLF